MTVDPAAGPVDEDDLRGQLDGLDPAWTAEVLGRYELVVRPGAVPDAAPASGQGQPPLVALRCTRTHYDEDGEPDTTVLMLIAVAIAQDGQSGFEFLGTGVTVTQDGLPLARLVLDVLRHEAEEH